MNKRKKNEIQMERLEKLSYILEKKEVDLKIMQAKLDSEKAELIEKQERQKKREDEFMAVWHAPSGDMISNTTDEIMKNLREVMDEYSTNLFNIRNQIEIMTAACNNAVSRIIEGGNRSGRELFLEELSNALYASVIDNRGFSDIVDGTMLEHSLVNISSLEELERVGKYGFRNNVFLNRVNLPEGTKEILPSFFFGCSRLAEVWIPDSVEKIGEYAFYGCSSLKNILIGKNSKLKEIGDYAFALNTSIKRFSLPDGVEKLGTGAFRGCEALEKFEFHEDGVLESVGSHMMQNCKSLVKIKLPEGITEIPTSMFFGCDSLKSVSALFVDTVGPYAFNGDRALEKVKLGRQSNIHPLAFEGTEPELKVTYEYALEDEVDEVPQPVEQGTEPETDAGQEQADVQSEAISNEPVEEQSEIKEEAEPVTEEAEADAMQENEQLLEQTEETESDSLEQVPEDETYSINEEQISEEPEGYYYQ